MPAKARRSGKRGVPAVGGPARLEWIAAAVSAAVVLALVAVLLREAILVAATPPDLVVTLDPPEPQGERTRWSFTVTNNGGRTASSVGVALLVADEVRRRLTIDYVAAHSEASGAFYLESAEAGAAPVAAVEGYIDP